MRVQNVRLLVPGWHSIVLFLLAIGLIAPGAANGAVQDAGRPLTEILAEFQSRGMELIYSSAVVTREMRVGHEARSGNRRERLERMLAPLGLAATDGPGRSILIVPAASLPGVLRGRVVSALGGHRVPIAAVQLIGSEVSLHADEKGVFEIRDVTPGDHRLRVTALGFQPLEIDCSELLPGKTLFIVAELDLESAFVTEVTVTPSRHTVGHERSASYAVTNDDVTLAPATSGDVSRVVEFLPGVVAADNTAAFHIRGSESGDASIVLDGLELYDPYHLQSFQGPYSLVDSSAIDRIDVRAGGFTADLGDRHGGFVEISTLVPREAGGAVEIGSLNSRFTYQTPLREGGGSLLVSGRSWYSDALFEATELGGNEDVKPRFQDLYVKTAFSLSPRWVVSGHGLFGHDRVEFVETGETVNETANALTRNINVWFRALGNWSSRVRSETIFSIGDIDKTRSGLASTASGPVDLRDDRSVRYIGLRHDTTWRPTQDQWIRTGIELRRLLATYHYSLESPQPPGMLTELELQPTGESMAVYGAYRRGFSERVAAEFGLRWDRQAYTDDNQLSPRFNLAWRPDPHTELRFALGRYQQSQRIHELNVQDGELAFSRAEVSRQIEFSFERALQSGVRVRVDAYYRELSRLRPRYENLFEPVEIFPEVSFDRVAITPDAATLQGLELSLRSRPTDPIVWWAGYTLASAEDEIQEQHFARKWDQRHTVKFLLGYHIDERWAFSFSGVMHSGLPITPVTGELVLQPDNSLEPLLIIGRRNSERLGGYRRFDLRVRRGIEVRRGKLSLTLDISNLSNRANACCVADFIFESGPAGPVAVATEYDPWLGIRPAINLLWEF